MNFEQLKKSNNPKPGYGFDIHWFLESFNDTFYKSCRDDFVSYFSEHSGIKKWMVFSDYVLHDKHKANDVIVFSIVPYLLEFNHFSTILNKLAPRDLKDAQRVDKHFIKLLASGSTLNIGVILNKKRKLCHNEKDYYKDKFEMMIKQLEHWCSTTPEAAHHYNDFIGKIKVLRTVVASPGANMKVIRDIDILATLAAYIMFEVTKLIELQTIGWFSDRDDMLSYKAGKFRSPFIFDTVHHLYYLLCNLEKIDSKNRLVIGVPENGTDAKVWYDAFNKIPDVIAGTLADYDHVKNRCSHDKFVPVLEEVFTSSKRNFFFKLNISHGNYSASRLQFYRSDSRLNR
jgi:hypothetical protein